LSVARKALIESTQACSALALPPVDVLLVDVEDVDDVLLVLVDDVLLVEVEVVLDVLPVDEVVPPVEVVDVVDVVELVVCGAPPAPVAAP
jgi:hypothetical protein